MIRIRIQAAYQVVSQQLHDECGILVAFLAESIKLGNSIIEGLLSKVASLVGGVEDLIVEDGEVQGETESDWVSRSEIGLGNLSRSLVCLQGLVGRFLSLVGGGEFGEVTMIITLPVEALALVLCARERTRSCSHLVIENLGFASLSRSNQMLVKDLKDVFADLAELLFDRLAVLLDEFDLSLIAFRFFLLLDGCDDSPGGTTSTNDVLVGNRQKISLFYREFLICRSNDLHVLNHFYDRYIRIAPRRSWVQTHLHIAQLARQALPGRQTPPHPFCDLRFRMRWMK